MTMRKPHEGDALPPLVEHILEPELRGVFRSLDVFLADTPEISTVAELSLAIRSNLNDVGGFQFSSSNPRWHQYFPQDGSTREMHFIVTEEPIHEALGKLQSYIAHQARQHIE